MAKIADVVVAAVVAVAEAAAAAVVAVVAVAEVAADDLLVAVRLEQENRLLRQLKRPKRPRQQVHQQRRRQVMPELRRKEAKADSIWSALTVMLETNELEFLDHDDS